MRTFAIFAVLALGLVLFGCTDESQPTVSAQDKKSSEQLILGKWVGTESGQSIPLDFRADGTYTVTIKNKGDKFGVTTTRDYRWTKKDEIEVTVRGLKDKILLIGVKVTDDRLTYKTKLLGEVYGEGKYTRAK